MQDKHRLTYREAGLDDLPVIIRLLADDALGKRRESSQTADQDQYQIALQRIMDDGNNQLMLACLDDRVIGTFQITWIPYLSYQGAWRCLIESVRVDAAYRSRGIGEAMMNWAIERARDKGCRMVQLTTNLTRERARHFYQQLGFIHSHAGMKLHLEPPT